MTRGETVALKFMFFKFKYAKMYRGESETNLMVLNLMAGRLWLTDSV